MPTNNKKLQIILVTIIGNALYESLFKKCQLDTFQSRICEVKGKINNILSGARDYRV